MSNSGVDLDLDTPLLLGYTVRVGEGRTLQVANPQDQGTAAKQNREVEVAYVICEPCIDVKDKACVEVCPVECIYEGDDQFYINPEECIDCGACEPECPVEAIFSEDDVPEKWASFVGKNAAFFG